LRARYFDQSLKFVAQFLRALWGNVILRSRKRRCGRDNVGNFRPFVLVARERLAHFGDGLGDAIGNANVEVGDGPGVAGLPEGEAEGVGLGLGDGVGLGSGGIIFSQ